MRVKVLKLKLLLPKSVGTVGDIESQPFMEAIRQMKEEVGDDNVLYIHTTLVPYLRAAGEMKTKPTQHSVRELRGLGIQPNILVVRTEKPITDEMRNKIALFCDVDPKAVIESMDVNTLYEIPLNLQKQGMDQLVVDHFGLDCPVADMREWTDMVNHIENDLKKTVKIAMVGKYTDLQDAYISVNELFVMLATPLMLRLTLITLMLKTLIQIMLLIPLRIMMGSLFQVVSVAGELKE